MNYRKLGRTGFEVSEIGHGLWGMRGRGGSRDRESLGSLRLAAGLGCNFFDTSSTYGDGKSDRLLGEILSRNAGKRLYGASKIPPLNRTWPPAPQDSYRDAFPSAQVFNYADLIRKALGVTSIDVLQFQVGDVHNQRWHEKGGSRPEKYCDE